MRKGDEGEKKTGEKIMMKIVATNVVASRLPERRPTATPTARAKRQFLWGNSNSIHHFSTLSEISIELD